MVPERASRTIVLLLLGFFLSAAATKNSDPPLGTILSFEGSVTLLRAHAKPVKLDRTHVLTLLREGDSLTCAQGGSARVRIHGQMVVVTRGAGLRVTAQPEKARDAGVDGSTQQTERERAVLEAIERWGRVGGSRGDAAGLYSPAQGSAIRVDELDIRWVDPGGHTARFELFDSQSAVWTSGDVDATAGHLPPDLLVAARSALRSNRPAIGVEGARFLMISKSGQSISTFSVLDQTEEAALTRELAVWNREPDALMQALGRATAFERRKLLNEAAREYDRAVAMAPDSETLRRAARALNQTIGNSERARELRLHTNAE